DRNVGLGVDDGTLKQNVELLARAARVDIRLDEAAIGKAGISPGAKVPLKLAGTLSLRSWLNMVLCADNLTFRVDDKGILVTTRSPKEETPELSGPQKSCAERIESRLNEKKDFSFKDATLNDVAAHFEQLTTENFVLDPAARKAGTLDPTTKVTGSAKDVP